MKKYYIVSIVLFLLLYVGVNSAVIILGGNTPVPFIWAVVIGAILLNTVVAAVCIVVELLRDLF